MKKFLQAVQSVLGGVLLLGTWVWGMGFVYLALQGFANGKFDMEVLFQTLPYLIGATILYVVIRLIKK